MRRHDQEPEESEERPSIVTARIMCQQGEPGSYRPIPGGDWYRDVQVDLQTGKTNPSLFVSEPDETEPLYS